MIKPYVEPDPEDLLLSEATDFFSLNSAPPPAPLAVKPGREARTDFVSLRAGIPLRPEVILNDAPVDYLINFSTPLLIFIMCNALLMYLLNVRYIYTSVHDANLRFFVFFMVLGVVALNRVIARQGSQESVIYIFALTGAVFLYTISTTEMYAVGSVSRNFLNDSPFIAGFFNVGVVIGVWWMINRLTHECCVDENAAAGDIGLFTAAAEKFRWTLQRAAAPPETKKPEPLTAAEVSDPWHQINAYDPSEYAAPEPAKATNQIKDYSDRLPQRHPGMALFYFSVPVVLIFSLGLRVIQHAGASAVQMGAYYMYSYVFCVLTLLSLTCLRQLRAYFSVRGVSMPSVLSWAWLGTSLVMVLLIMWLASVLPMPSLPPVAYVDEQQISAWEPQSARLKLIQVTPPTLSLFERWQFRERLELTAQIIIGIVLVYALLKALQYVVGMALIRKEKLPLFLSWIITALAWFLLGLWPALSRFTFPRRRIRMQRSIARSSKYQNPFSKSTQPTMTIRQQVAYAYEALRALAADVGQPPAPSQTPFEFLENFPQSLQSLREEAEEIIRLYVIAAYSDTEMNPRIEDRLRKFWSAFHVTRNRFVR